MSCRADIDVGSILFISFLLRLLLPWMFGPLSDSLLQFIYRTSLATSSLSAPGVTCVRSTDIKDQLVLTGNSINDVSQAAAQVHQKCRVCDKVRTMALLLSVFCCASSMKHAVCSLVLY